MLDFMKKLFETEREQNNEFVWHLAEALLWRDEGVSMGAIPSPIKEQTNAAQYYDDALDLIQFVQGKCEFTCKHCGDTE